MKLLAIDTSTEACSAALSIDENVICRYEVAPRKHAELILPMIDGLLSEAGISLTNIDALAFGRGPGAFTGIRVATGVIQGLAYAQDLPVIPISSLATLAQSLATEYQHIIPAFDARMGEIYSACYQVNKAGLVELIGEESVTKPAQITLPTFNHCHGIGSGWETYGELLAERLTDKLSGFTAGSFPNAEHMIPLAIEAYENEKTVTAEQAIPVYLRNKVTF